MFSLLLLACSEPDTDTGADDPLAPIDDTMDTHAAETDDTADPTGLVINEFMAYDVDDGFAHGADWIEVYNGGPEPLDLSHASLWSDDGADQYPWIFPAGMGIDAGAWLVVICDETNAGGDTPHASFRIAREGGTLELRWDGGALDRVSYEHQTTGLSSARTTDGGAEWASGVAATPGASNDGAGASNGGAR